MVSWQTAQSLLLFFGPLLLPKLLAWYRSIKNRPATSIKPLSQPTAYALSLLFFSGLLAFLSTLPLFSPENIFQITKSRLHTSGGVLLTRLSSLRPLTPSDETLREIFDQGGLDARLLYILFGPSVILTNPLVPPPGSSTPKAAIDLSRSHLIYALPTVLTPHILHLFAIGLTTSPTFSGAIPQRWRTLGIISALALAAGEVYYVSTYDHGPNTRSTRPTDIDFVFWKLRVYRGLAMALIDGLLGWMIYLQATGRAFVAPLSPAERIADHAVELERLFAKARGMGVLRNATVRDAELRGKVEEYWVKEGKVMKDVSEEAEVLEAQRNALRRIDMARVSRDAESFVDGILGLAPGLGTGSTGDTIV